MTTHEAVCSRQIRESISYDKFVTAWTHQHLKEETDYASHTTIPQHPIVIPRTISYTRAHATEVSQTQRILHAKRRLV